MFQKKKHPEGCFFFWWRTPSVGSRPPAGGTSVSLSLHSNVVGTCGSPTNAPPFLLGYCECRSKVTTLPTRLSLDAIRVPGSFCLLKSTFRAPVFFRIVPVKLLFLAFRGIISAGRQINEKCLCPRIFV